MESIATVYVVDDDPGVRKSLGLVLKSELLEVALYESGEAFLEQVDAARPGCVVVDLRMPGISGLDVLQRLRAARQEIPAIIISGHADVPATVRGMKLGAIDLLQKPFEPAALLDAVQSALKKSVAQVEQRAELADVRRRLSKLTPRELELLKLVVAGMSNKQIAPELHISIKTVANHRTNLMQKTKALNAADLARLTTLSGICADPDVQTRD